MSDVSYRPGHATTEARRARTAARREQQFKKAEKALKSKNTKDCNLAMGQRQNKKLYPGWGSAGHEASLPEIKKIVARNKRLAKMDTAKVASKLAGIRNAYLWNNPALRAARMESFKRRAEPKAPRTPEHIAAMTAASRLAPTPERLAELVKKMQAKGQTPVILPNGRLGQRESYSRELADTIIERVSQGEMLADILGDIPLAPRRGTIMQWRTSNYDDFGDRYALAEKAQADAWADLIVRISDDEDTDVRSRTLRTNVLRWLMERRDNQKWGTRTIVAGDPANPIGVVAHQLRQLSDSELAALEAFAIARAEALEAVKGHKAGATDATYEDVSDLSTPP